MSIAPSDLHAHLAVAITGWEKEGRDLDAKISALVVEKDGLSKRLEAARLLLLGSTTGAPAEAARTTASAPKSAKAERAPRVTLAGQWKEQILAIVRRYDRGCTYAELRAALSASPLGDRLAESDKSYQRAMSRLGHEGSIERGYGRVFTPSAFKTYNREVGNGVVNPVLAQPMARSPMGEAILKIVHASPGIKSKQVIAQLRHNPEFHATLTPHETGAFNIISRLVRRQQIVKRDDGGCFPGLAFPHDLLGLLPNGERAPNGIAAGALSAEEARTSPIENQPALRLIG